MKPQMRKPLGRERILPVSSVVFFGAFYFFLWLCVQPKLIYHYFEISRKVPFFETGWLFLQDSLGYPGGLGQYLAAFLTQLCYFSWLGALCLTFIAWSIYRLTASLVATRLLRRGGRQVSDDSPWRVICYMPALLILMVCGRYEPPMSTAVAVLVAAFFSVLYEKLSPRLGLARVVLFLIICGVVYYIAASAALLFVALAALYEFFNRRKPVFGLIYLLLGTAVCWLLGFYIFELETAEACLYMSPFNPTRQNRETEKWARVLKDILFVVLPVVVLLANWAGGPAENKASSRQLRRHSRKKPSVVKEASYPFYQSRHKWVVQTALLVIIAVPSVFFSFDCQAKKKIQVDYFACRRMWPELLAAARSINLRRYTPFCGHAVNRALYHTGRLGDEMFAWPQSNRTTDLVFGLVKGSNVILMERIETCMELGLVHVAERIAHEFLGWSDDKRPFVLRQFVTLYIVKGQIETARVFLRSLSKDLVYGKEAKELLQQLESDSRLESDKYIQYLRSIMINTDDVYAAYNEDRWLEELLRRNRNNKMAFEYLMAHYLLTRRLDKFVENLGRLDDFGYERIPRHYQEAILIYMGQTQKRVDLGNRKLNPDIGRQYLEMNRIGKTFGYSEKTGSQALAPRFGRTYFYYFIYGTSGVM
jgi:hypothetical protein